MIKASSGGGSSSMIEDLSDDLLRHILLRLPTETAIQCKLVSKRWYAIVSDPYFALSFVSHHNHTQPPNPFVILSDPYKQNKVSVTNAENFDNPFKFSSLNLDFMRTNAGVYPIYPAASYNDLLLCFQHIYSTLIFYVCNPFTKQWLQLPPLQCQAKPLAVHYVGFVCDQHRIVVLILWNYYEHYEAWKFSSETGTWISLPLSFPFPNSLNNCPRRCDYWYPEYPSQYDSNYDNIPYRVDVSLVACNARLYWIVGGEYDPFHGHDQNHRGVVEYDPFRNRWGCFDFPSNFPLDDVDSCNDPEACIRIFRGSVGLCQFTSKSSYDPFFYVWGLEKEDNCSKGSTSSSSREWFLAYKVNFGGMFEGFWYGLRNIRVQSFQPYDEELVYLQHGRFLLSSNMRQKTSQVVYEIPRDDDEIRKRRMRIVRVFVLVLPWWPTFIPQHYPEREIEARRKSLKRKRRDI